MRNKMSLFGICESENSTVQLSSKESHKTIYSAPGYSEFLDADHCMYMHPTEEKNFYRNWIYTSKTESTIDSIPVIVANGTFSGNNKDFVIKTGSHVFVAQTVESICISMNATITNPDYDMYEFSKSILSKLCEELGPRRSVALVWKLFSSSCTVQAWYEHSVFTIIAALFPGLCVFNAVFELKKKSVLYNYLVATVIELGWLGDGLKMGIDTYGPHALSLWRQLQHHAHKLVGPMTHLAFDLEDVGDIVANSDAVINCLSDAAKSQGINNPRVLIIGEMPHKELINLSVTEILMETCPLVLGCYLKEIPSNIEDYQKYIFPYCSVIVMFGEGLSTLVDPRKRIHSSSIRTLVPYRISCIPSLPKKPTGVLICEESIAVSLIKAKKGQAPGKSDRYGLMIINCNSVPEIGTLTPKELEKLQTTENIYVTSIATRIGWKKAMFYLFIFLKQSVTIGIVPSHVMPA